MSSLQAIPAARIAADGVNPRAGSAANPPGDDGRLRRSTAQDAAPTTQPAPGVQASFSPQSLRTLEDAALGIAGSARDLVEGIGEAGGEAITAAADLVDTVGAGASAAITSGADALVKGIGAMRSGVTEAAGAVEDAVSAATGRVGNAVESAVGYAALAALAGGALLNELV